MNQAVFCVTPSARASSHELIPFFALAMHQTATNHLSRPSGESSKMVPTLKLNCFLQSRHFRMGRVDNSPTFADWQRGQVGFAPLHLIFRM